MRTLLIQLIKVLIPCRYYGIRWLRSLHLGAGQSRVESPRRVEDGGGHGWQSDWSGIPAVRPCNGSRFVDLITLPFLKKEKNKAHQRHILLQNSKTEHLWNLKYIFRNKAPRDHPRGPGQAYCYGDLLHRHRRERKRLQVPRPAGQAAVGSRRRGRGPICLPWGWSQVPSVYMSCNAWCLKSMGIYWSVYTLIVHVVELQLLEVPEMSAEVSFVAHSLITQILHLNLIPTNVNIPVPTIHIKSGLFQLRIICTDSRVRSADHQPFGHWPRHLEVRHPYWWRYLLRFPGCAVPVGFTGCYRCCYCAARYFDIILLTRLRRKSGPVARQMGHDLQIFVPGIALHGMGLGRTMYD